MRKLALVLLRFGCLAVLVCGLPVEAEPAGIYTVAFSFDSPDKTPGDNICADTDGSCTLRAAIMEANAHPGPDTIMLPATTVHLSLIGAGEDAASTGDLDLTGAVTLQGMGPGATIIDATGAADRVFDVLTGTTASLTGLAITGGRIASPQFGAGIQNWGALTLTQVIVTRNDVANNLAQYAGGIASWNLGVLVLAGSQVISNTGYLGGGIYNKGQATLNGSRVTENWAQAGAGLFNEGVMVLNGTQVLSNSAFINGGGLYNTRRLAITGSTIGGNLANGGAGIDFLHLSAEAQLTIDTSTIRGNITSYYGGAGLRSNGATTVTASLFMNNSSQTDGGAIEMSNRQLYLANVTLAGNQANRNGGGLVTLTGASVDGYNLTIIQNTANADGVDTGTGGGAYRSAGTLVSLYNSVLAFNSRRGGDFYVADDCSGIFGVFSYDLIEDPTGCDYLDDHTLTGQNPLLLPLAGNGGPTLTSALAPGSPLMDAGDPAGCAAPGGGLLATDQRGYGRHVDGNHDGVVRCDIGAFEAQWRQFLPLIRR
jgi:predicted outer membrane repeat protein